MQYVIRYSTEACADIVTLSVEVGGRADEEEVKIPPVEPIIELGGVEKGQVVSGTLDLKTEFLLVQCPIREVSYFVNSVKMVTMAPPFTWEWDTSTLPDNPNATVEVDAQGDGLIKNVAVRVEAIDQEGRSATDEVSGFMVQLPSLKVEILSPIDNEFIERWASWRTKCEDTEPTELSVKIQVTQSGQRREIERVEYYLDGQLAGSLQTLPDQHDLNILTVGCTSLNEETPHTVKVWVVDELGRFGEAEVPLTVKVHVETFWEMIIRIVSGIDPPMFASVLSMALALTVLVVFLRSPQRTIEIAAGGIRKITEFLGVASKGTRLILIENGKDGRSYAVMDVVHLGRDQGRVDIVFDEPRVSGLHATLVKENEDFVLYDQGSKNGTWVNEQRLRFKGSQVLENGDIIGLGPIRLRFEREGEPEPEVEIEEE
ncbi:MAG: FHA domain-containing protein [Chloroflexi bacterium]|nr:FHA domain-containing protein [Chloroflexota bacterium]